MNAQFETLPRFSSIREVEEWEQSLRKPEMWLASEDNDRWHAERKQRERDHIRSEKSRLERIEQERPAKRNAIKNVLPYSDALASEICERISIGELLLDICEDEHLPTMRRCNQWLKANHDFAALYKDSINDRLDVFQEEVIKIADDMKKDFKEVTRNGRTSRVVDPDVIARAKSASRSDLSGCAQCGQQCGASNRP